MFGEKARDLEVEYLRQVELLTATATATAVEAEDFDPSDLRLHGVAARNDALGQFARVFTHMAGEVYSREQGLKRQLRSLQIEVDKVR